MPNLQDVQWIEHSFHFDRTGNFYCPVAAQKPFEYSDGEEVESRLLAIMRGVADRGTGSVELARSISDFASRYHLSSQRANLLRPVVDLLHGRTLIVGAGCGAEARFIGEAGGEVWAVEGSSRRAEICAERCRDLPNVKVFNARIEDFDPPVLFDAVTLVGVLEYSPRLLGGPEAPTRLLSLCRRFLQPGGVVIVAIENLMGLKYFAGAPEDHIGVPFANMNGGCGDSGPVTFGQLELEQRFRDAGLSYVDFLYPFPDYKFPRLILHASADRELGDSLGEMVRFAAAAEGSLPYSRSFAEEMCWPAAIRNGLIGALANSFLAIARQTPGVVLNANRLAFVYTDQRRREYAKESIVERAAEGIVVRRQKLYPAAVKAGPYTQVLADEPFHRGSLLISAFADVVNQPGWSETDLARCGEVWAELLKTKATRTEALAEAVLPPGFVDCTPSNVVVAENGDLRIFDQEWIAAEPVPLPFVLFRGLFAFFVQVQSIAPPAHSVARQIAGLCRQVLELWGCPLTTAQLESIVERECALQQAIGGISPDPDMYLALPLPAIRIDHRPFSSVMQFDNGVPVAPVLSECHAKAHPQLRLAWSAAPAGTGFGSFFSWLNSPAPIAAAEPYAELAITQLAAYIYSQREDVRTAFPDLCSEDRLRFTEWLLQYGASEYALDGVFLRPAAVALDRWRKAHEVQRELDQAAARQQAAEQRVTELEDQVATLRQDLHKVIEQLERNRQLQKAEQDSAEQRRQDDHAILTQTQRAWAAAERRAASLHIAGQRYAQAVEHTLKTHRGQRAWKLMLATRRAYTLAILGGWKGRMRLLFGPRRPVEEYEIEFPSLTHFLPDRGGEAPNGLDKIAWTEVPPGPRRYDVIILAIIDFDFRFQRPQQIATQFARNGHRVFWLTSTRVLPPDSPDAYRIVPLRDGIWEVQVRAPQCDPYVGALSDDCANAFRESLSAFYRDWAIAESAILVQLPFWRRLAVELRREPFSIVVYDCMDDWDTFENLGDFNRTEEVPLAAECDLLCVTAAGLSEKFTRRGLEPVLVRNGADFKFFRAAEPLAELADLPRPIVGYFGAIADWIDLDLIYEVAKSRPQYSFVLAGQVFGRDVSALESLPNVRLLGPRPYEQMPALLAGFDACTIPFLLNQVTHATDPVKLYEYLSQGKPVVATDMSELRGWSDLVYLANGAQAFAERLDTAIAESDPGLRAKRIEFARTNSWASRVADLDRAIATRFPKISILIVTYNSAQFLGPCLRGVLANTSYPTVEIIVVDNASTDGSAALAQKFASADSRIRVVSLPVNTGFAGGNNAAAKLATGEYLVLLNADTIVTPGWLAYLLRHMALDPKIGLICPVTNHAGNEIKINVDYLQETGMREFAMRIAREKRGAEMDIAVVPLFCGAIRRDLFFELGGLDEGYRIGMFEDDDLAEAVRQRGLRVCVAEDCFVHHFGQGAFAKLDPAEYNRIFAANHRRFENKWNKKWVAHQTRPGVRSAFEEPRFSPEEFCDVDLDPADVEFLP